MTAVPQRTFPVEHPSTGEHAGTTIVLLHGGNVANWMWEPQVAGLADHHLLTPDLPGFGQRTDEPWHCLTATAADVATTIRARAQGGRARIVGLSLGAMVAAHVLADHPDVVTSAMITGASLSGVHGPARRLGRLQLALPGGEIRVWGSTVLLRTLAEHDLVDEYRLAVYPLVLGTGKKLFPGGFPLSRLALAETRTLSTGVVVSSYRRPDR